MVGFARRNYMVPMPEAANIDELNEKILQQCLAYGSHTMAGREQSVDTLYEEEKNSLLPQPEAAYSNIQPNDGRADKYATVMVDNNRYSIPWRYVGHKLKILLHVDQVEIFAGTQKLAVHERLFGNNKWSLNPDHYLELIQQRPMSFDSARPIRPWREKWPESLHRLLASFCCSQGETKGIKPGDVEAAVELALENNISTSDGVLHILIYANETGNATSPLADWPSLPLADVTVYGVLGGVH